MPLIGDHSTAGAIIGGSLRAQGFGGVIRYACGGRGDVNITPEEVRDLEANGLFIGIVLEHEAGWLLSPGRVLERVRASVAVTRACGLPDGVIYMAADTDITEGGPTAPGSQGERNMNVCLQSLQIAAGEISWPNVGWYGSKFSIDWLIARGVPIEFFWQTEAWSERETSPAACLFQRAQSVNVGGVNVDLDDVWKPAWGARGQPAPPPVVIDLTELEDELLTSTTDRQGNVHVFAGIPHDKDDPSKGLTIFELYQTNGRAWAGGDPGKHKALGYRLAAIPDETG